MGRKFKGYLESGKYLFVGIYYCRNSYYLLIVFMGINFLD